MGYNMTNAKWFAGSVVGGCPLWTKKPCKIPLDALIRVNIVIKISTTTPKQGLICFCQRKLTKFTQKAQCEHKKTLTMYHGSTIMEHEYGNYEVP